MLDLDAKTVRSGQNRNKEYLQRHKGGSQMPGEPKSLTYGISKVIEAPLPFVYEWCTDFREDDAGLTGSQTKTKILEKTSTRVIMIDSYEEKGKPVESISVVSLKPPNAWHLDYAGNESEQEVGSYKLTKLGANKTRLDMKFTITYAPGRKVPLRKEQIEGSNKFWDKLVVALMKDYSK